MTERNLEYDRFGPWVTEISDEDPTPPLFVPYITRPGPALLSIKIPRKIERRQAHAGMDLYDFMVSFYEDDIVILQRVEHEVQPEVVRYSDVQLLRLSEDLLRGNLHLGLTGRSFDLPYNTVSGQTMRRVVDLVRQRYDPGRDPVRVPPTDVVEDGLSFYFQRLLEHEEQQGSGMRLIAAQAEATLKEHESNALRRLLFGILSKRLLEALHLSDGRELKIIGRGRTYAYRWQATYGTDICYIPTANITAVSWDEGATDAATTSLTLRTASGDQVWAFNRDNPSLDSYRTFLATLPVMAQVAA